MTVFFEKYVLGALVPIMLIGIGIFFLFYLRFFFLRGRRVFSVLIKRDKKSGVSPFAALTVALAGTLGVGNIVGVAGAIILGGAGSVFWMLVCALAAMVLKYAEIVLAKRHRRYDGKSAYGGAMYYIEDFLSERGHKNGGKFFGSLFAMLCMINSLSMGCMLQSNSVSSSFGVISPISPFLIGAVLAFLVGIVISKGIRDISALTTVIIPTMTVIYVLMSLFVIVKFRDRLPSAVLLIFRNAFSAKSVCGGVSGSAFALALRYGAMRGLLSNEAGCGTAPMAHAAAENSSPAEQGLWGIVEVFVDTVLLCTLTALSILLTRGGELSSYASGDEMKIVLASYGTALGRFAPVLMTVMVFFFAYATIICCSFYGTSALKYLCASPTAEKIFKLLFIICVFIGCGKVSGLVWQVSDFALGCMTVINLVFLVLMRKEILSETERIV